MLFDTQSLFSDAQAVTGSAASTNVIDLGAPGTPQHAVAPITQDLGRGRPIPIVVQVVTDFAALTSLQVGLQVDTVENFASPTTVVSTAAIALANLKAGYRFSLEWLPTGMDERFARLYYTVGGSNATAGAITAGLVFGRANWTA